jgi:hypothetical protein
MITDRHYHFYVRNGTRQKKEAEQEKTKNWIVSFHERATTRWVLLSFKPEVETRGRAMLASPGVEHDVGRAASELRLAESSSVSN